MTQDALEKHLLSLNGAEASYPFGPGSLVFKVLGKMFALTSQDADAPRVTLKCSPDDNDILTSQFEAITPGYHMNKRHWITVQLTDEVPDDLLINLADESYRLVVRKLTKVQRRTLSEPS